MARVDYGTASHKEIIAGFKVAMRIAKQIQAVKNPAVRDVIKKLIALIRVKAP